MRGSVTPVPGSPEEPIGTVVDDPAPVQVPLALPSSAAVTAQAVTGTSSGTDPVGVVARCDGSHEFDALPATATTALHALIGASPSTGAPWLTSSVGTSLTSGKPALGMHIPVAVPYTSAMTPQTVAGVYRSANWPCCVTVLGCWGQVAVLLPSISAITSHTVTGTAASITPFCVVVPFVPLWSQLLDVSPTKPTFTAQMLTGASTLTAAVCVVDEEGWPAISPSEDVARPRRPIALFWAVMGTLTVPMAPSWFSPTELVEQLLFAPASSPMESEQAFTGALTLTRGDACVVVFVPVVALGPGSVVLPISLPSAVTGSEVESGSVVRGGSGLVAGVEPGAVAAGTEAQPTCSGEPAQRPAAWPVRSPRRWRSRRSAPRIGGGWVGSPHPPG